MSCLATTAPARLVLVGEVVASCRWCGDPAPDGVCAPCGRLNAPAMLQRLRQGLILMLLRRGHTNTTTGLLRLLSNGRLASVSVHGWRRPGVLTSLTGRTVQRDLVDLEAAGLVERTGEQTGEQGACHKHTRWWAVPLLVCDPDTMDTGVSDG